MEIQRFKPPKTIEKFMLSNARRRVIMGPFGCLSADTEFLTPGGWKRIDRYENSDMVAEFDTRTNAAIFRAPLEYVKLPCESFFHLKNRYGIDQLLSAEHTVLFNTRFQPDLWQTLSASDLAEKHNALKDGWSGRIPTTFAAPEVSGVDLSDDELRLMVAVCADGHYNARSVERTCSVCVRKERKKARMRRLLLACGIEWEESNYASRPTETTFRFLAPETNKTLGAYWGADSRQLALILEECAHWDGHVDCYGGMIFSSCDKDSADLVQYAAATQGKRATVTPVEYENENWRVGYRVHVNTGATELSMRQAPKIEQVPSEDGFKYCFATSTGFFIARRNGRIFVTGNSGKSSGCCVEIPRRAAMQSPWKGTRKTRFAIIRNTMPQLRDTTIKTWLKWFPNGTLGHWVENTRTYVIRQGDIYSEVLFRALDTPDDVAKLLSLELTGVYINECREIPKEIVDGLDGRINRYPSRDEGGADWCGIIADTNPPTEEEYWYYVIEGMDPDTQLPVADNGWESFIQPSGLSEQAENLENLPEGYYRDLAKNKSKEYIDVYIHGKYGKSKAGKPVHPTFDPHIHVARDILVPNPRLPILISADFGLTPAMTIKQQDVFGRVLTLDEIVTQEMGLKRAIAERLKPLLKRKYEGYNVRVTGDPAGNERAQTDEKSCVQIFKDAGFRRVKFARSNNPVHRIGATDSFLSRLTEQGPAYQIDPRCSFLKRGMAGGYHYPINRRGEVADGPKKNIFSHVCFVGSTEISTPHGRRRLEDIRVLDLVNTPLGPCRVTGVAARVAWARLVLFSDGRVLEGTDDHPLFTRTGLVPLGGLNVDDRVIAEFGPDVRLHTAFDCFDSTVYALGVEGAHCYFANGILVSNCESGQYGDMYFERLEESPDDDKDRKARVNDSHERARQQVYGRRD